MQTLCVLQRIFALLAVAFLTLPASNLRAEFRAGAAKVNVTPDQFPVLVNGGMVSRSVSKVNTPVHARSIVMSEDDDHIALVIVDSCMMSRSFLDDAKALIESRTKIPRDRILISATHTHTAPASMGCLGTDADPNYVPFLRERLAVVVEHAKSNQVAAQIGFGAQDAPEFTALRRWIRRPDRIENDPFGNPTVRANMHAGRNWDDVTGESGPEDPELSLIAIQSAAGEPIAVLANFSMHYFGDRDISADYFGLFSEGLAERIGNPANFVGILSHGCSGDIWRRDYTRPAEQRGDDQTIAAYTTGLLDVAEEIYKKIQYRNDITIDMEERRLPMKYRIPDAQRLAWAKRIVDEMGERLPKERSEIYAREQVLLHEWQETEIVVQAIRLGDIAIATTPTETYALTGLKIKAASPQAQTMVIELANGGDGYIPPPEQHVLGGYNTWAARSAGLEIQAESRVTEACIELLESVTGRPRRAALSSRGPAARNIENLRPLAWWRCDEMTGPDAADSSRNDHWATYEPGVTFYLAGPTSPSFTEDHQVNRAAMFAGGRLRARLNQIKDRYTISMWIWNGMPTKARSIAGWCFSRGFDHGLHRLSEHLGLAGAGEHEGRLIFFQGSDLDSMLAGKTAIPRWTWHQVALVRDRSRVRVYLNGELEFEGTSRWNSPRSLNQFYFAGRSDRSDSWEGRLDEIAVFDRVLNDIEIRSLSEIK